MATGAATGHISHAMTTTAFELDGYKSPAMPESFAALSFARVRYWAHSAPACRRSSAATSQS